VTLYAEPSAGYDTENDPSSAMKRGLVSTGVPNGGSPQSGGHTYLGGVGVATTDTAVAAEASTASPVPSVATMRR
jgi:hypothetical protein